jgi:hypothetical protein
MTTAIVDCAAVSPMLDKSTNRGQNWVNVVISSPLSQAEYDADDRLISISSFVFAESDVIKFG